ncbi:MAG: endonuclease III domain-containing protein [Candidatus Aureabacteria bacterium]|nr:endonuclease III domain-containing protein [Candidatus Auribacterota bacterium]
MKKKIFENIYHLLLKTYGPQGWWPLIQCRQKNAVKNGPLRGYHENDYTYPKNSLQQFEIAIGAVATQNTSWIQAEKAMMNLHDLNLLTPNELSRIDLARLGSALKPAGYFNQKAKKMKILAEFWLKLARRVPERNEWLKLWGIGPETADSILLYAFRKPVFVVDAYTKRLFSRLRIFRESLSYDDVQNIFENNLESSYKIYQEYHALIVEHAKRHCKKKPVCQGCVLKRYCRPICHAE